MSEQALFQLKNINQIFYTGKKAYPALENISLSVDQGEFVALVGPAGCGKSTLLRIVTGLQKATSGSVLYRHRELVGINSNATIVFQTFALFPWLTVQENVEVALKRHGLPPNLRSTRAIRFLDMVGLDGFETAYPRELSGGMRQKVGFARAMALEPELLCLDEPFTSLDALSANALRNELLEIWQSGKISTRAILLVTHNIEEAVFLADRIIVMDKQPGKIVADLRVGLSHPRNPKQQDFIAVVDRVYATLAGQTQSEQQELGRAPGEPGGKLRALPNISINSLNGLLEYLDTSSSPKNDIYRLEPELKIDSEQLLLLTEAAELLGFATIAQGDISLTPLGETFAEAGILARKEIFSSRIKRLPMIKWLMAQLDTADQHQLALGVVQSALELEFPPEEAEQQLKIAITWGRYSELLAYDDNQEMLFLEASGPLN